MNPSTGYLFIKHKKKKEMRQRFVRENIEYKSFNELQ